MSTALICPALRSFVTEVPYLAGWTLADLEYRIVEVSKWASRTFYHFSDTTPMRFIASALDTFGMITVQTVRVHFGLSALTKAAELAKRLSFIAAPAILLYQNSPTAITTTINRIAQAVFNSQLTKGIQMTAQYGMTTVNKLRAVVYYPYILGGQTTIKTLAAVFSFFSSKAFLAPAAAYFLARPAYEMLCDDYEQSVKNNTALKPLDLFDGLQQGYYTRQATLGKDKARHAFAKFMLAKSESEKLRIIEQFQVEQCAFPYNGSNCFCD